MDKYNITFDLIENKKGLHYWIFLILFITTFLLLLFFLFIVEIKFWKNTFFILFSIQLLISIFSKEKIIGSITLNEEEIILNQKSTIIFLLSNLSEISIMYNGAEGTLYSNPKSIGTKDGTTNYISFQLNNQNYKYRFKVRINQILTLKKIISVWKMKYQNINFVGTFEKY